jgi:hypothetical protein
MQNLPGMTSKLSKSVPTTLVLLVNLQCYLMEEDLLIVLQLKQVKWILSADWCSVVEPCSKQEAIAC